MTLLVVYSSPLTPIDPGWAVDISGAIRLGSITGLAGEAEMGAVGTGNVVLDDPVGTVGHLSDGIVGLKSMSFRETACPVGNQRLYTAYTADRRYHRGQSDSLITGVARKIDVTLTDLNSFLSFRVFAPVADDPTSSFVRSAESSIERIQGLLNDVDFISTTLFDIGYIPTTGGVDLDAVDYTGKRPINVLNDIALANKWNFWVLYDEATNHLVLWMDDWKTDGSSTKTYDSPLRLTNVETEHNGTTTFAITPDAVGVLDPSRVVAAEYGIGNGITSYRTFPATANTFAWRDGDPLQGSVSSQAKLDALLDSDLGQNSTEDNRISCTVELPNTKVTSIHEGMRIQVHFTHIPEVQSGFTWCRILQRTIRQDRETPLLYWLDLELSPIPATVEPYAILYRSQSADNITGGTSQIGWLCSGDNDGFGGCNNGTYPTDPTVGPLQTIPGTFGGTIATIEYLGLTMNATGTIDIEWGGGTAPIQVFTSVGAIAVTVELRKNGVAVGTSILTTPGGGSGHTMPSIVVTAEPVVPGDIFTATFYFTPGGSDLYIDGGNLIVTGGALA